MIAAVSLAFVSAMTGPVAHALDETETAMAASIGTAVEVKLMVLSNDRSDALDMIPTPSVAASAMPNPLDLNSLAVGYSQESYLSRDLPNGKGNGYQLLSARLRTRGGLHPRSQSTNSYFSSYLELGGGFSTNVENSSYVMVPEAYMRWSSEPASGDEPPSGFTGRARAPGLSLLVGRAKERWSRLDEEWSLGLWQPFFGWDWLRTESQGLSGAFMAMETDGARLMLFGTPLFIPEQGAPFELQNGHFSSSSPWFSGPPESVMLLGMRRELQYSMRKPSIGSVIGHGAGGAMAQLGDPSREGLWMQASYAFKPRNQLDTPFDAYLPTGNPAVSVYPQVGYHHVMDIDAGARAGRISAWISALHEIPISDDLGTTLTFQRLLPMTAVSPNVEFAAPWASTWHPRLIGSYLHRDGGDGVDVNSIQSGSAFGARFPYKEAVSLSARATKGIGSGRILDFGMKIIQELAEDGTIIMADIRYQPALAWTITAGMDLIASGRPEGDTSTMIARDRGNDRAFLGAAYAF